VEEKTHIDCEEYRAIDVFKGLCTTKGKIVPADEAGCEDFRQAAKCRFCRHYTPTEEYLGLCMGKATAYPDLLAKACSDFAWKGKEIGR
jgi:hypothetical protein